MRLDVDYNVCSKLGSIIKNVFGFGQNYGNFNFARPFLDFDCIFLSGIFLKVGPDRIHILVCIAGLSSLAPTRS